MKKMIFVLSLMTSLAAHAICPNGQDQMEVRTYDVAPQYIHFTAEAHSKTSTAMATLDPEATVLLRRHYYLGYCYHYDENAPLVQVALHTPTKSKEILQGQFLVTGFWGDSQSNEIEFGDERYRVVAQENRVSPTRVEVSRTYKADMIQARVERCELVRLTALQLGKMIRFTTSGDLNNLNFCTIVP